MRHFGYGCGVRGDEERASHNLCYEDRMRVTGNDGKEPCSGMKTNDLIFFVGL